VEGGPAREVVRAGLLVVRLRVTDEVRCCRDIVSSGHEIERERIGNTEKG